MKVKRYADGGKNKKVKAAEAKSRAQEVEAARMEATRRSEDLAAAERIRKDVRSEVGPGASRPSTNKGNVTLSTAKSQAITSSGSRQPDTRTSGAGKYTRGQLAEQLSGQKVQPIYKAGETMGYAKNREISAGPGFTMKPEMPKSRVAKSGLPTPKAKQSGLSPATKAAIAKGANRSAELGAQAFAGTMDEAKRKGYRL